MRLTNEDIERFCASYHRNNNGPEAARSIRPEITTRAGAELAARILQTERGQRELIRLKKETSAFSPLKEYVEKLEEIRDAALTAGKFAPAVQAHMVIGKLAGYFDKPEADASAIGDAAALSNEELLRRIEHLTKQQPRLIEADYVEVTNE